MSPLLLVPTHSTHQNTLALILAVSGGSARLGQLQQSSDLCESKGYTRIQYIHIFVQIFTHTLTYAHTKRMTHTHTHIHSHIYTHKSTLSHTNIICISTVITTPPFLAPLPTHNNNSNPRRDLSPTSTHSHTLQPPPTHSI